MVVHSFKEQLWVEAGLIMQSQTALKFTKTASVEESSCLRAAWSIFALLTVPSFHFRKQLSFPTRYLAGAVNQGAMRSPYRPPKECLKVLSWVFSFFHPYKDKLWQQPEIQALRNSSKVMQGQSKQSEFIHPTQLPEKDD